MSTTEEQKSRSANITTAIITLVIGAGLGVAVMRWYDTRTGNGHESPAPRTHVQTEKAVNRETFGAANTGILDPFDEMQNMRAEIDRVFQRTLARFRSETNLNKLVVNDGYSSSLDVRDLKDRFEVRAYLPDAETSRAQVDVKGNQLRVEVTNQQADTVKSNGGQTEMTEWGRYDQLVQLPDNVQADKMKVERKDHELIITLPKTT